MEIKIVEILKNIQPDFAFEDDRNFIEAGYLDSFDIIALITDLEETFRVNISALDILPENFSSVSAIISLIEKSAKKA